MQCTNCKSEILATAKFCPECGYKVENIGKTCPNSKCNRTGLPLEAMFCPDCGTKLISNNEIVVNVNDNIVINLQEIDDEEVNSIREYFNNIK